jgi:hypothetical protein
MKDNPPRRTLNVWIVITILGIFAIFAPTIFGMDGFNGGFAISTISFMLVVTGIIVIIIYSGRARTLDKIFDGNNLLAHWTYSPEEWSSYADTQYKEEKGEKKALFFIIAGFALFFGVVFMIMDPESGIFVMGVMLALIAIIAFTAWFTSWYNYRENKKYLGETYITEDAVYINRQLHTWRGLGARLDSVDLNQGESPLLLKFVYSAPTRTGMQEYTARIPVPKGQEESAEKIFKHFKDAVS